MIAMLIWTLAVTSVPPVYMTSQLDEGMLCVFLHWESSAMVRYSLPLMKGDRLNFSSHLKCRQEVTH
jgi:hypothetical protein